MTPEQADQLQYYIQALCGVLKVNVHERTQNITLHFNEARKAEIERALSLFDYESCAVEIPEGNSRELRRETEDKLFFLVARRIVKRVFLPYNIRAVITVIKAIPRVFEALRELKKRNLTVSVLDAVSISAAILQRDFSTASTIMFLLDVGDLLDEWTHKKSVDDLAQRMMLNVDKVWVRKGDQEELLPVNEIAAGETIVVRTGNVIPFDGTVVCGDASVNQASMTGEAAPVHKSAGSTVFAGTVIDEGEIDILVKEVQGGSRYDKIVQMIEDSEKLKSSAESRAAHIADRLVPYSLGATLLVYALTRNVAKAMAVLMVDYSCALKLAMPVSVLSAMQECSAHHINVKGGKFLESVAEASTIVFDKTGTLTCATPKLKCVVPFGGHDETEMLRIAACLEEHFPHSVANAVVNGAKDLGIDHDEMHASVEYIVAHGIASSIDGVKVVIGSRHFVFDDEKCRMPRGEERKYLAISKEYTQLFMAIGGELAAVLCIEDPIRPDAKRTIEELHAAGFKNVVMMTGDSERTAKAVAERLGIDEFHAEVLPEDKAAFIRSEHAKGRKVVMIGDGINDSPALSEADAGVAIAAGAAIAREVADITISADELHELVVLKDLSGLLMKRIDWNYRTIMGFNSMLIVLGVAGVLPAATTALLHNASTLAIGLKSMTPLLEG